MERDHNKAVSYDSMMDSPKYVMLCARLDICFVLGIMSKYWFISLLELWVHVKHILKYLWRTRDYMLVSLCDELILFLY